MGWDAEGITAKLAARVKRIARALPRSPYRRGSKTTDLSEFRFLSLPLSLSLSLSLSLGIGRARIRRTDQWELLGGTWEAAAF